MPQTISREAVIECSDTSSFEAAEPGIASAGASSSRASTSNASSSRVLTSNESFDPSTLNNAVPASIVIVIVRHTCVLYLSPLVQLADTNSPSSAWAHVTQEHFQHLSTASVEKGKQKRTSKAKAKGQRKVKNKQPLERRALSPEELVGEDCDAIEFNDNLSEEDEDGALPPVMKTKGAKSDDTASKIPLAMLVKVYVAIKSF